MNTRYYDSKQDRYELDPQYGTDSLEMAVLLLFSLLTLASAESPGWVCLGVALGITFVILVDVIKRAITKSIRPKAELVLGILSGVAVAALLCSMKSDGEVVRGLVLAFTILAIALMYMFFRDR